jgi:uncharacterized protein (DUF1499 family)
MNADTFPSLRTSSWPARLARFGFWLIGLGLALAAASGPANRFGLVNFRIALLALGAGFVLLLVGALLSLIGVITGAARRARLPMGRLAVGIVAALAAIGYLLTWVHAGTSVPTIHEVSTDLDSPPPFVEIRRIRDAIPGTNSSDYVAELTGRSGRFSVPDAQRAAYPDLQPLVLNAPPDQAFKVAEAAARKLGWEIVAAVPAEGRLEATATTRFFGFKDDVVVRLRVAGAGTRVDVRSKSRVGLGDAGANAARVRAYLGLLRGS